MSAPVCVCVWGGGEGGNYSEGNDLKHKSPWLGLELQQSGRQAGRTEAEETTSLGCLSATLAVGLRLAHELTMTFSRRPASIFFLNEKDVILPPFFLFADDLFIYFLNVVDFKGPVSAINMDLQWFCNDEIKWCTSMCLFSLKNPIEMIVVAVWTSGFID